MATVNVNVFSTAFQNLPNFDQILEILNKSDSLVAWINSLPTADIGIGAPGSGGYTQGKAISFAPELLASPYSVIDVVEQITHELGHAVLTSYDDINSPYLCPAKFLCCSNCRTSRSLGVAE